MIKKLIRSLCYGFFAFSVANSNSETQQPSTDGLLLTRGERAVSPKHHYECIAATPKGSLDGVCLVLTTSTAEPTKGAWVLLDGNRTVSIAWSADDLWLVVFNNFGAAENEWLLFKLDPSGPILFKKSPPTKSSQVAWDIKSWNLSKDEMYFTSKERFEEKETDFLVKLK